MSTTQRAWLLGLAAILLPACDDVRPPLDGTLDPSANVVTESPEPFAPVEGGFGQGRYEGVPFTYLVLTEHELHDAGETNCGQFASSIDEDLELRLFGVLAPGTYPISTDQPTAGTADLWFGNHYYWTGGSAVIEEGSEERGTLVRGTLDATSDSGERLVLSFAALFFGCGLD